MDPLAKTDSSSDEDAASQTTEDDPRVPENQAPPPPPPAPVPTQVQQSNGQAAPVPGPASTAPQPGVTAREKPHYELRHTMRGHTKSLSAVKFSPDGTILASCGLCQGIVYMNDRLAYAANPGADNVVKIWNPFTGVLVRNLSGHTAGNSDIAWSPDGVFLASASDDTSIRIWDVDSVRPPICLPIILL
jgi:COMPASS component SWD3